MSNSEILKKMMVADNTMLYNTTLTLLNLDLYTPFDFDVLFEQKKNEFEVNLKKESEGSLLLIGLSIIGILIVVIIALFGVAMKKNRVRRKRQARHAGDEPEIGSKVKFGVGSVKTNQSIDKRSGYEGGLKQPGKESWIVKGKLDKTRTRMSIHSAESKTISPNSDVKVRVKDLMSMIKQK